MDHRCRSRLQHSACDRHERGCPGHGGRDGDSFARDCRDNLLDRARQPVGHVESSDGHADARLPDQSFQRRDPASLRCASILTERGALRCLATYTGRERIGSRLDRRDRESESFRSGALIAGGYRRGDLPGRVHIRLGERWRFSGCEGGRLARTRCQRRDEERPCPGRAVPRVQGVRLRQQQCGESCGFLHVDASGCFVRGPTPEQLPGPDALRRLCSGRRQRRREYRGRCRWRLLRHTDTPEGARHRPRN